MGKIIAIVNQKGGVGKTTTSINLSASLGVLNKKVLLVDLDPQGNATTGVGIDRGAMKSSIYEVLVMKKTIEKSIVKTKSKNLSILPAYLNLAGVDMELIELEKKYRAEGQKFNRVLRLKEELDKVRDKYDFIFIDCPPSLGILTTNALGAADSVLIPVQSEYFALRGMTDLFKIINKVRRQINPTLKIDGALLTLVDKRTNLPKEIEKQIKDNYGSILKLYDTKIPRAVKTAESTSSGGSIFSYDKSGTVAEAYSSFAKEVLDDGKRLVKNATAKVR